jgi:hypothetical protein
MVVEFVIDTSPSGSIQVAYYFIPGGTANGVRVCRTQDLELWVDGVLQKTLTISNFQAGKYVVFDIDGLTGNNTITLKAFKSLSQDQCTGDFVPGVNEVISGLFIGNCEQPGETGCTPGYWRQDQHFDSWTSPLVPATLFSDVFCDGPIDIIEIRSNPNFGGGTKLNPTLLEAVWAKGGGINALARHAVAALLNASANIGYPLSVDDVKTLVCDALADGSNSAYEIRNPLIANKDDKVKNMMFKKKTE